MQIQRVERCLVRPGEDVSDRVHQIKPKGFVALYITYVMGSIAKCKDNGKSCVAEGLCLTHTEHAPSMTQ